MGEGNGPTLGHSPLQLIQSRNLVLEITFLIKMTRLRTLVGNLKPKITRKKVKN